MATDIIARGMASNVQKEIDNISTPDRGENITIFVGYPLVLEGNVFVPDVENDGLDKITVMGINTKFLTDFSDGDYISFIDSSVNKNVYTSARIETVVSDVELSLFIDEALSFVRYENINSHYTVPAKSGIGSDLNNGLLPTQNGSFATIGGAFNSISKIVNGNISVHIMPNDYTGESIIYFEGLSGGGTVTFMANGISYPTPNILVSSFSVSSNLTNISFWNFSSLYGTVSSFNTKSLDFYRCFSDGGFALENSQVNFDKCIANTSNCDPSFYLNKGSNVYVDNTNTLGCTSQFYISIGSVIRLGELNTLAPMPSYVEDSCELITVKSGATEERPNYVPFGYSYMDTTLSKPIWFVGVGWADAVGTLV